MGLKKVDTAYKKLMFAKKNSIQNMSTFGALTLIPINQCKISDL